MKFRIRNMLVLLLSSSYDVLRYLYDLMAKKMVPIKSNEIAILRYVDALSWMNLDNKSGSTFCFLFKLS